MAAPLADRIRPQSLDEMVGQQHLLGPNGLLRRIAQSGTLPNLIFYGPSGVGKTTAARIIAAGAGKKLYRLNGTTASTGDIKALIADLGGFDAMGGVVLYLDEIQYLNKKQQQTLLEYIEDGSITLIASTTENPYFYVYNAILSRCTVFEFKPVDAAEVERYLESAMEKLRQQSPELQVEEGALAHIAACCGGDVRKAANALEICALGAMATTGRPVITLEDAKQAAQRSAMRYDREGDQHYDLLSALQKSIRGSDPDAAVHYLGRLLEAGDLLSPCRHCSGGHRPGLSTGHCHSKSLCGCRCAAGPAGGPHPTGGGRCAAGHSPQVQRFLYGHQCRYGRYSKGQGTRLPALPAKCPLRQRRGGAKGTALPLPARFPQSLGGAAVPAG